MDTFQRMVGKTEKETKNSCTSFVRANGIMPYTEVLRTYDKELAFNKLLGS